MQLTGALLKPNLEKKNFLNLPLKKFLIFQELELSCPRKLNQTFLNFLALNKLNKTFSYY